MKRSIRLTLIFLLFISNFAVAQDIDTTQLAAAKQFLTYALKGQHDSSWQLLDKANAPRMTKDQYDIVMEHFRNDFALFDNFELTMNGVKIINDKTFREFTFKAIATTKNVVDEVAVDVFFVDSSKLIAGIQPKKLIKENTASTANARETPIQQRFVANIGGTDYTVTGVNIVHFADNKGLLAIQVEYTLPSDMSSRETFAKKEAIKFAKYLVKNGYIEKAKIKAQEINKTMLEDIGVSFFDATKGGGYNVMLKPSEYR